VPYKNSAVKSSIRNNKFHYHTQSAQELAQLVDQALSHYDNPTIIPIPSSSGRIRTRGYQHLLNILQHSQYHNDVSTTVLQKKTNTPSQSHVTKTIRLQQQQGTFRCNPTEAGALTGTVILLDDVVTTGATMQAAKAAVVPHLASGTYLVCLAIAH